MNLVITDKPLCFCEKKTGNYKYIDLSSLRILNCLGCFSCWVKTPGACVIKDDAPWVYPLIAKAENLIYVTKVVWGSYDIPFKTLFERSIPIQKAFIRLHNGETHHEQRDVKEKKAVIIAYDCKTKEEEQTFRYLVSRNANNMNFKEYQVIFATEENLAEIVSEEVKKWENC